MPGTDNPTDDRQRCATGLDLLTALGTPFGVSIHEEQYSKASGARPDTRFLLVADVLLSRLEAPRLTDQRHNVDLARRRPRPVLCAMVNMVSPYLNTDVRLSDADRTAHRPSPLATRTDLHCRQ